MKINLTNLAHSIIGDYFSQNKANYIIDATLGNGYDTLNASKILSEDGKIFGFDIQKTAIEKSQQAIDKNNISKNVQLFNTGHENMEDFLPDDVKGKVNCIFFNLGWLPKSDKSTITKPQTTLKALKASLRLLDKSRGILSVLSYRGHEGGVAESLVVKDFFEKNLKNKYQVFTDESNEISPILYIMDTSEKST